MTTIFATINPQYFLLEVFLFCVASVTIAIFMSSLLKNKAQLTTPSKIEKISTEGFTFVEMIAVGLVILLFSTSIWLPLLIDLSAVSEKASSVTELEYAVNMSLTIVIQFIVPCVILIALLSLKVNILDAFGIRKFNPGKVAIYIIGGLILTYTSLIFLMVLGYEQLVSVVFDSVEDQPSVQAMKAANTPLRQSIMIAMAVIVAPLCEEIIFRSFLYTAIKKYTGFIFAATSSAMIFSVVHASAIALLPLFIVGIVLALVYEFSGSIWTSIAIHAIFNLVSVAFMLS